MWLQSTHIFIFLLLKNNNNHTNNNNALQCNYCLRLLPISFGSNGAAPCSLGGRVKKEH